MTVLTALNGRIPSSLLVLIERGQSLRSDAAASFLREEAAGMPKGCLRSGYRDLDAQVVEVARAKAGLTPSAAPAGQSFHGEGTAADVDEPARTWIRAHGAAYGWAKDHVKNEPWHMEYDPATDRHIPAPTPAKPAPVTITPASRPTPAPITINAPEDDMYLKFATNGSGYLVTPDGVLNLTGQEWNLFQRLKNSQAGDYTGDQFLGAEIDIMAAALKRLKAQNA